MYCFTRLILTLSISISLIRPLDAKIHQLSLKKICSLSCSSILSALIFLPAHQIQAYDGDHIINTPKITSSVFLDISINRKESERVEIGLYGDEAPRATRIFLSVCNGDIGGGVNYDYSQVSRIQKNRRIDVNKFSLGAAQRTESWKDIDGKVRLRNVDLAKNYPHNDVNNLRHDAPGIVSVVKGGQSFGFTIAPAPSPDLDDENVVIGKVSKGLDTINRINNIPVSHEDILGTKQAFSQLGKGVDGRAKLASVDRPLQKVQILECKVQDTGSIASFLKY